MSTTHHETAVVLRDPAPHAKAITDTILGERAGLPHELNGRPKCPSSVAAAQIRRDMQQGRSAEVRRLLTVLGCDVIDGVPLPTVLSVLDQMAAYLRLIAGDRTPDQRDLAVLTRMETRAEGRLNMAQLKALESPACEATLTEVLQARCEYDARLDAYMANVQARLAFLRGTRSPMAKVMR